MGGIQSRRKHPLYTTAKASLDDQNITDAQGVSAWPMVWPVSLR